MARALLGCILISRERGGFTAGRIVETEAYLGPEDRASHAAFRPSARPLFYGPGGIAYVFWAYGRHACLNAIAGGRGTPGCVLIRAIEPLAGLVTMSRRRGVSADQVELTNGPAKLTQALGVTLRNSGADLTRGSLCIAARPTRDRFDVLIGPRLGITHATGLPLRYAIRDNRYVSRPRPAQGVAPSDVAAATSGPPHVGSHVLR